MQKEILDRIQIIKGDITRLQVEAIVNAANTSLLGGGGVDGAIHRAAGPGLLAECRSLGGCPTGEARITKGYNLPAKHVIHTVGPVYNALKSEESRRLLKSCYENSLALARKNQIATMAFPAISCGVYGYPIEDASKVALKTVCDHLASNSDLKQVVFALFSDHDLGVYQDQLERL